MIIIAIIIIIAAVVIGITNIIVVITHVTSMQNIPSKNVALRNKLMTKRDILVKKNAPNHDLL